MPKDADSDSKRLNLDLPAVVYERIRQLENITGATSTSEVLRRSLSLYDLLARAVRSGETVVLRKKSGQEREVLILD